MTRSRSLWFRSLCFTAKVKRKRKHAPHSGAVQSFSALGGLCGLLFFGRFARSSSAALRSIAARVSSIIFCMSAREGPLIVNPISPMSGGSFTFRRDPRTSTRSRNAGAEEKQVLLVSEYYLTFADMCNAVITYYRIVRFKLDILKFAHRKAAPLCTNLRSAL